MAEAVADISPAATYNSKGSAVGCAGQFPLFAAIGTVDKALFTISCTTCRARLKVRSEEALGAILECPKCGSMVQVVPPPGWKPPQPAPPETPANQPAAGSAAWTDPVETSPERDEKAKTGTTAGTRAGAAAGGAVLAKGAAQAAEPAAGAELNVPSTGPSGSAASGSKPPPLPSSSASATPPGTLASPTELLWRKLLLTAAVPLAAVVIGIGAWAVFFSGDPAPMPPDQRDQTPSEDPADPSGKVAKDGRPLPTPWNRRWLPDETVLLVRCHPSQWADHPAAAKAMAQGRELWQPTVGRLMRGLGLKLDGIRRLTWAVTDLAAWSDRCVVVVELEEGHDATLLGGGEPIDITLDGAECRRLHNPHWPHPFAVVGPQTIVTGEAALLGDLAGRSEPSLQSPAVRRLLSAVPLEADAMLIVDLAAARQAGWRLPAALFDVWPAAKGPWHVVWEVPAGLGVSLRHGDRLEGRLALVCEGPTAVADVKAAVDELLPAAREALGARLESLPGSLRAGEITAAAATQYEVVLADGLAAAEAARCEVADEIVLVHVPGGRDPAALAAAALDCRETVHTDWLAAARRVDEANHGRLIAGLGGYAKAEGRFPSGVAGGALLAPETRLSWVATMLPYLDHSDWHRQLEFGYPWNGPQNREIARQELPEVVNPAVGPQQSEAGYPATHYVGLAGVGPDAGQLPPNDPRAGVFGYRRSARPEEVADGASNTIAVLGVTGRPGPWAAGGEATVRALTRPPYVNGPDGFGSGQPDGMLAAMADGSVRFISKDIDPRVVEQLATIAGGEATTVVALDVRPRIPLPAVGPKPPGDAEPEPVPPKPVPPGGDAEPGADPARGPAPELVDVRPRLTMRIPQIELPSMPLGEAVDVVSNIAGVPVSFDPQAMAELDVSLRDEVQVDLSGASVEEIFRAVSGQRGLVPVVEEGLVLLTSPAEHRQRIYAVKYTVSDLAGDDPGQLAELGELLQELVVPESWRPAGGPGVVEPAGAALRVHQTAPVHRQVLIFCEKLRVARDQSPRSRHDPELFRLASRRSRARAALGRPATANFHDPVPLAEIVSHVGRAAGVDIFIDRVALHAAGLSAEAPATLTTQKEPLSAALDRLAASVGVAWRVVDAQTLQITSPKALRAQLELEFYPIKSLLGPGRSGPGLAETLQTRVEPGTWGDGGGPGLVHFDGPSGCLIVLQSQPVQAAVERLLGEMADAAK